MKPNLLPEDTDLKIPAAVKAQIARSENYFKKPEAEPEAEGEKPEAEKPEEAQAEKPDNPQVTEPPKEKPAPTDESWEHRYNSMKGRFEASQNQVKALSDRISQLENILATMQATTPVRTDAPKSDELKAERLITPEEEADYGEEFLKVVGKKAKEELSPLVQGLLKKIEGLEAQVAGVGTKIATDARGAMIEQLNGNVPNWREINHDDKFKAWLALPDTFSGAIRHDLLKAAWERNDSPRVQAFFKGFLAEEAVTSPASQGGAPSGGTAGAGGKPSLEDFAAPGRAKSAAAHAPAEKPVFTRSEIAAFYAEVAAGRWFGREKDKDAREKEIFAAQAEGRIRD